MCDGEEVNDQELRHGGQRKKVSGIANVIPVIAGKVESE
jgi:hypothetical protein